MEVISGSACTYLANLKPIDTQAGRNQWTMEQEKLNAFFVKRTSKTKESLTNNTCGKPKEMPEERGSTEVFLSFAIVMNKKNGCLRNGEINYHLRRKKVP